MLAHQAPFPSEAFFFFFFLLRDSLFPSTSTTYKLGISKIKKKWRKGIRKTHTHNAHHTRYTLIQPNHTQSTLTIWYTYSIMQSTTSIFFSGFRLMYSFCVSQFAISRFVSFRFRFFYYPRISVAQQHLIDSIFVYSVHDFFPFFLVFVLVFYFFSVNISGRFSRVQRDNERDYLVCWWNPFPPTNIF